MADQKKTTRELNKTTVDNYTPEMGDPGFYLLFCMNGMNRSVKRLDDVDSSIKSILSTPDRHRSPLEMWSARVAKKLIDLHPGYGKMLLFSVILDVVDVLPVHEVDILIGLLSVLYES